MVSTAQFPDSFKIPNPYPAGLAKLVTVGYRKVAVVQFATVGAPEWPDFAEACGGITAGPLPPGYAVNTSSPWSPTWVIYNAENAVNYTNECWMEVMSA